MMPHHAQRLLEAHTGCDDDESVEFAVLGAITTVLAQSKRPKKKRRGGSRPGKAPNVDRVGFRLRSLF